MTDTANISSKNVLLTRESIIRFQLMTYMHLNNLRISVRDINCLTLLGLRGNPLLIGFCNELVEYNIFSSVQSARNAISKLQDMKLVCKNGSHRRTLFLCPDLDIRTTGSIVVNLKLFTDVPGQG